MTCTLETRRHRDGHVWVAVDDGRPVGMTALIPSEAESELEPIVVARAWRGHGVGRTLADTVIDAARARGDRQLVTRPVARNDAAIRFFHGLGFDVLGQLELFVDLVPQEERRWRRGVALAGRDFRV